jgi:hypothetical protein
LASLLSLEIEDDDGNDASKPTPQSQQQKQDDGKAWLSEKQFKDALDRIKGGEKDLFDKLTIAFRMKKEYKQQLEEAANTF